MPSKSKSQQRLFCMAYAVRKGKLKRSDVSKPVLAIADGDMTDKQIEDFMVRECSLVEYVKLLTEGEYDILFADGTKPSFDREPEVFIIVKPGFCSLAEEIIDRFTQEGFEMKRQRTKKLSLEESKKIYEVHKKEDFYDSLCKYMSSDTSIGITFTHPEMSEKDMFEKTGEIKDFFRDKYSESDMRNVMHSSDSQENMRKESAFYL